VNSKPVQSILMKRSVIDIRDRDNPRRSHGFVIRAPFHHQGNPVGDPLSILGIFHAVEAMMGRHRLEPLSEERNIVDALHEAQMTAPGRRINMAAEGPLSGRPPPQKRRLPFRQQAQVSLDLGNAR
jgi:hypothetical protein